MKATLDRYISRNYNEVWKYTEYFLTKMKVKIQADVVINNSYLHVIEINDNTTDEDKVKSYLLNTIKKQIMWSTSASHTQEKVRANEIDIPNDCEDEHDLNYKIKEELKYQNQKAYVEMYRRSLSDRVKVIIFEAYFDKGYTTSRAMAAYFDIPDTSAYYFIKEIKRELKRIQDENQERV